MKTTTNYLDEILLVHPELKNDSRLAELLSISRQAVSQYRTGKSMSVIVAVRVARLLHLNPMETISATMAAQATTEAERSFWTAEYDHAHKP